MAGLCFQGFLELFFHLSKRLFAKSDMLGSIMAMLDYCEESLCYCSIPSLKHIIRQYGHDVSRDNISISTNRSINASVINERSTTNADTLKYERLPLLPTKQQQPIDSIRVSQSAKLLSISNNEIF